MKVPENAMVTMDMHFGRVRVFVNSEGKGLVANCDPCLSNTVFQFHVTLALDNA